MLIFYTFMTFVVMTSYQPALCKISDKLVTWCLRDSMIDIQMENRNHQIFIILEIALLKRLSLIRYNDKMS